jgi:hypothetical protein
VVTKLTLAERGLQVDHVYSVTCTEADGFKMGHRLGMRSPCAESVSSDLLT